MDTTSKLVQTDYLRQTTKLKLPLKLKLFRVPAEEDMAFKQYRYMTAKANRKYVRRSHRRIQLAKLTQLFVDSRNEENESAFNENYTHLAAGGKAPQNTTQFLMSKVYEDMKTDIIELVSRETPLHSNCGSVSPSSVYSELDCDYDGCLAFQQKDFEETFGQIWKPE